MECAIKYCTSYKPPEPIEITYHEFPTDKERCAIWTDIVRKQRNEDNWEPTNASRICSIHFKYYDRYKNMQGLVFLRKTAKPTRLLKLAPPNDTVEPSDEPSVAAPRDKDTNQAMGIDEFKSWMIQAVARVRKQNTPDEDFWQKMKEETGSDCQLLWERMCSLTVKKLHRLLHGGDRISPSSGCRRMSATDWLLFDLILVHEDIDVIGRDSGEMGTNELKPLVDLISLVMKYRVEECTGNDLVKAWHGITVSYSILGFHQVSPMLLQLRWHQLKEMTRKVLLDLSRRYNARQFGDVIQHATGLPAKIAEQFPSVVTKPFEDWKYKIKKGLVIVPQQFEEYIQKINPQTDNYAIDNISQSGVDERVIDPIALDDKSDVENGNDDNFHAVQPRCKLKSSDAIGENGVESNSSILHNHLATADQNFDQDSLYADIKIDNATFFAPFSNLAGSSSVHQQTLHMLVEPVLIQNKKPTSVHGEPLPQIKYVFGNVSVPKESLANFGTRGAEISDTLPDKENNDIDQDKPLDTESQPECDVSNQLNVLGFDNKEGHDNAGNILENAEKVKLETDDAAVEMLDIEEHAVVPVFTESAHNQTETPDAIGVIIDKLCEKALKKLKRRVGQDTENKKLSVLNNLPIKWNLVGSGTEIVDNGIEYLKEGIKYGDTVTVKQAELKSNPDSDLKLQLDPVVYLTNINQMENINIDANNTIRDKALLDAIRERSKPIKQEDNKKEQKHYKCISEDEHYMKSNNRVNISHEWFKKPLSHIYTPKMLCTNPDFNTSLKLLHDVFFNITENVRLLAKCKPLTIDVSKAFESKLKNGRISLNLDQYNIPPKLGNNSKDADMQPVTVVPPAMSVQSNSNLSAEPTLFTSCRIDTDISERRRGIHLLDIAEVRHINQKLLIAQVTAMQVQNKLDDSFIKQSDIQPSPVNISQNIQKEHDTKKDPIKQSKINSSVTRDEKKETVQVIEHTTPTPFDYEHLIQQLPVVQNTRQTFNANKKYASFSELVQMFHSSNKNMNIVGSTEKNTLSVMSDINANRPLLSTPEMNANSSRNDVENDFESVIKVSVLKKSQKKCCWASAKMEQVMKHENRTFYRHTCSARLCTCCCKEPLMKYEQSLRRFELRDKAPPRKTSTKKSRETTSEKDTRSSLSSNKYIEEINDEKTNRYGTESCDRSISNMSQGMPRTCVNIVDGKHTFTTQNIVDIIITNQLSANPSKSKKIHKTMKNNKPQVKMSLAFPNNDNILPDKDSDKVVAKESTKHQEWVHADRMPLTDSEEAVLKIKKNKKAYIMLGQQNRLIRTDQPGSNLGISSTSNVSKKARQDRETVNPDIANPSRVTNKRAHDDEYPFIDLCDEGTTIKINRESDGSSDYEPLSHVAKKYKKYPDNTVE